MEFAELTSLEHFVKLQTFISNEAGERNATEVGASSYPPAVTSPGGYLH